MPMHLHTLGDHLRAKRIVSGYLQKDVAVSLNVCEDTITGWENGRFQPEVCRYPAIIAFLGYYPFSHDTTTLSGKLQQLRYCKGLDYQACGVLFGVHGSTIRSWEKGTNRPTTSNALFIQTLWQQLPVIQTLNQ
ncbi:MAG: transcriptional regulator [Sphingobacteriales bacterium]